MRLKSFLVLSSALGAMLLAGCVGTIDGRKSAGVPFTKDKLERRYERTIHEIWDAAKDVLKFNGRLYGEDMLQSTLEASVDQRTVWVRVEEVDAKVSKVTVQARTKAGLGDVETASWILEQIGLRLATGSVPLKSPPPK
ncbi:MAG TPA: DUF3568 family protein [Verrucomicrobiae bacterium]|jgi:hypothetical protein